MGFSPSFQFYVGDWLGSPTIMMMTPAEEGAYIRLLAIAWNNDGCKIPASDDALAKLSRLGDDWMSSKEIVLAKWRLEDGHYVCDRLLSERKKQEHNRNARSKAGMASAEARGKRNAKRGRAKRQPEDKSWEENFNSFMAIFPKKTHLTKAKALWKRKKPDFETVKTALEWQIKLPDWTKEGGKYSPNPESYLENEQWKYENPYKKQSVPTQYGYDVAAALQRQKERSCQVTP